VLADRVGQFASFERISLRKVTPCSLSAILASEEPCVIAAAPASGRLWHELTTRTTPLRRHLEDLRDRGDPELLAAAVGAMLAGLNHALPTDDGRVADANLVLYSLAGPRVRAGTSDAENRTSDDGRTVRSHTPLLEISALTSAHRHCLSC
jgi:hypothetical protein